MVYGGISHSWSVDSWLSFYFDCDSGWSWPSFLHHPIDEVVTAPGISWGFHCLAGTLCLCTCSVVLCGCGTFSPPIDQSSTPHPAPAFLFSTLVNPQTRLRCFEPRSQHIFTGSSVSPIELFASLLSSYIHCLVHHHRRSLATQ